MPLKVMTSSNAHICQKLQRTHMEEIYVNAEPTKPTKPASPQLRTSQRGARSSERRRPGCVALSLGLLSVSLLAGLIGLGVTYGDLLTHSSAVHANLTERLRLQNASLTERSRELEQLQKESRNNRGCPAGWTFFRCSCYLLVTQRRTWEKARDFCTTEEAHLVTIDHLEEQTFVEGQITGDTWIGLNDREQEGRYNWTDGSPLTQTFWSDRQPDNSVWWGEEDCVHLKGMTKKWNDRRCDNSMHFICEKTV